MPAVTYMKTPRSSSNNSVHVDVDVGAGAYIHPIWGSSRLLALCLLAIAPARTAVASKKGKGLSSTISVSGKI